MGRAATHNLSAGKNIANTAMVQNDNAIAERVNGTLKTEIIYREQRFVGFMEAERRIASFIDFYNDKRPHSSIGMKVPSRAHQELGEQHKCW